MDTNFLNECVPCSRCGNDKGFNVLFAEEGKESWWRVHCPRCLFTFSEGESYGTIALAVRAWNHFHATQPTTPIKTYVTIVFEGGGVRVEADTIETFEGGMVEVLHMGNVIAVLSPGSYLWVAMGDYTGGEGEEEERLREALYQETKEPLI